MKAKELIAILSKNPEAELYVEYPDMGFGDWFPTRDIKVVETADGTINLVVASGD